MKEFYRFERHLRCGRPIQAFHLNQYRIVVAPDTANTWDSASKADWDLDDAVEIVDHDFVAVEHVTCAGFENIGCLILALLVEEDISSQVCSHPLKRVLHVVMDIGSQCPPGIPGRRAERCPMKKPGLWMV